MQQSEQPLLLDMIEGWVLWKGPPNVNINRPRPGILLPNQISVKPWLPPLVRLYNGLPDIPSVLVGDPTSHPTPECVWMTANVRA
mmetsp:Transcript_2020/g.3406  ORF Transcript_2020/g.3406 Transcript_2020/m.3406 type:complete len:85 (-) Transcript_2020:248-502(-)